MDYEKKYKEALELARVAAFNGHQSLMEGIFPELKESEDERIRKEIQSTIKQLDKDSTICGKKYDYNQWLAWLEKQGEQKPTLPKWKYKKDHTPLLRDSIILNKYGCVAKSPSGAIVSDVWVLDYGELTKLPKEEIEKQGEKKPIEEVNGEDYGIDGLWHAQRILENTLGSVYGYQTDDGILDHKAAITAVKKLYKQKHAWSEEDENVAEDIEEAIRNYWHGDTLDILLYWLKKLKQRIGG